ncbi:MAG: hypothetical protein JWN33_293 [Candidatus Saccharibacteria bacterium]|nr:hypothetical protein [Candidatus Saccharibacteria bacterium]
MKQVCIIHGGDTYPSVKAYKQALGSRQLDYARLLYRPRWNNWLPEHLPGVDVLLPSFPNKDNAQYDEWSLYFAKLIPFLENDVTLIGHSLGGIFLAKFLSESPMPGLAKKLVLIAAPYDDELNEPLATFKLSRDATNLSISAEEIYLFHSEDDPVVPFSELSKYRADLQDAQVHTFQDRLHCNTATFPELLDIIKK